MKKTLRGIVIAFLLLTCAQSVQAGITNKQLDRWGELIYRNECGGRERKLTSWNKGEAFASLGIGHFIWYPKEGRGIFRETFPEFIVYATKRGISVPGWVRRASACPWSTRKEFLLQINSPRMIALRTFLKNTRRTQVLFMIHRLQKGLPEILKEVPKKTKTSLRKKFSAVAAAKDGYYVLIDYTNFKGGGILKSERYHGQGWGLRQVLQEMTLPKRSKEVIPEFVRSAKKVIERRVANSPKSRNEARWLPGWKNRLDSYLRPACL